ncbi:hypothetical protein N7488_001646 [Penicillium malachiteum]|nr:hypothetical protein N7488_001646 [Penicillium malachiteum]
MSDSDKIGNRAAVLTLISLGKSTEEIADRVNISQRAVQRILKRAKEKGFNPQDQALSIKDIYIFDNPRSGRPRKQEGVKTETLEKVRLDRYGREKTCAMIAGELTSEGILVSPATIWRVLKRAGMRKTKPTRKPGLTKAMRDARLNFCLEHQDWTLEDWKNVIWSDETSVILLHRRGGYRVWRNPLERFVRSYIRERWKGASEFMFWGCFLYNFKGPCHCWKLETAREKKESIEMIEAWNSELEPIMREKWELETGMRRVGLRNQPGKAPKWKWIEKNGKLSRTKSRGGIDWFRYHTTILAPKLLPFAQKCQSSRPKTLVQEDKAPAHAHHYQQKIFDAAGVARLLWCGNSPDLNAIEAAWPYLKRETTKKGAPKTRSEAIKIWEQKWDEMPQEMIQRWIERIPHHIQRIIELEGGNEYLEGRG